jgi:DNA repair photolyase
MPVGVIGAPIIPMISARELKAMSQAAARSVVECSLSATGAHVPSHIHQSRTGQLYHSTVEERMKVKGISVQLIARRFAVAVRRAGLGVREEHRLDYSRFCPPGRQMALL